MTVESDAERTFEAALAAAQDAVDAAARAAGAVSRELKKARGAAAAGSVRDLRRSLAAAESLGQELASSVREARAAYDVDEGELLASGTYVKELLAAAADAGLAVFEEDDRLLCYPSVVRVLPGDGAIEIDRRRERRLRPSVVVALLGAAQQAGPRFKPEPFLAGLLAAYDLVVASQRKARGTVVRVLEVYAVLTLLPGQSRDYSKQEFARDLYLLDQSATTAVGSTGVRLRWAASTGTKAAGVLTTVARSGQIQRYWGIAFQDSTDSGAGVE